MPVGANDAVRHYQQRQTEALQAMAWFEQLQKQTQAAGAKAQDQLARASIALAEAYLPGLTAQHLQTVEQLTGYVGFKRRDPLVAMAHERHTLQHTVERISKHPQYLQREVLAGKDGTMRAKLAQAQEMIEPFAKECATFESLPMFLELVSVKYDTSDFDESWWNGDYWKHWSAGDKVCEALGMADFGDDVLPAYQKVATQRDFWRAEIEQLNQQLNAVHQLVRQHDQAVARLPQLARLYLEQTLRVLAEHLREADAQLLDEWRQASVPNDRSIQIGLRRLAGTRAKFEILKELHQQGLKQTLEQLRERASKYARKSAKYLRPKYAYQSIRDSDLDHKFGAKLNKLRSRQKKLAALVSRIDAYDDYESFQLHNDQQLWWSEITGGKRAPREITSVHRYYQRNPNATPARDKAATTKAVSRAAADIPKDDIGYLS